MKPVVRIKAYNLVESITRWPSTKIAKKKLMLQKKTWPLWAWPISLMCLNKKFKESYSLKNQCSELKAIWHKWSLGDSLKTALLIMPKETLKVFSWNHSLEFKVIWQKWSLGDLLQKKAKFNLINQNHGHQRACLISLMYPQRKRLWNQSSEIKTIGINAHLVTLKIILNKLDPSKSIANLIGVIIMVRKFPLTPLVRI